MCVRVCVIRWAYLCYIKCFFLRPIGSVGYDHIAFARPDFYDLLLARIPSGKIHFNKKVIAIEQNEKEAKITCSDGTSYSGDVLVGADGAYSAVRQGLYKQLGEENILPAADAQELNKGFICMVGTTKELPLNDYPGIDSKEASINQILGQGNAYSVWKIVLQR